VRRLLVAANVVPSSSILVTLMMGALSSSETSVITRATRRNIPEDAILEVLHTFLNVFVQIANNMGLQNETYTKHIYEPQLWV
jgi:NhaP-type Na+/H+ or K+/H+ antiporter